MEICHVVVWGKLKRGEGKLKRKGEGELVSSKNYCKNKCETTIYLPQITHTPQRQWYFLLTNDKYVYECSTIFI